MPELVRLGGISIRMYADDHHPPHFHIVSEEFEVMVAIATLKVIKGQAHRRQIAESLAWAKDHQRLLENAWRNLNERG